MENMNTNKKFADRIIFTLSPTVEYPFMKETLAKVNADDELQKAAVISSSLFMDEMKEALNHARRGCEGTAVMAAAHKVPRHRPYGEAIDANGASWAVWVDLLAHEVSFAPIVD